MSLPEPGAASAALVTGASSGLGAELARSLAARGHNLLLVARRTDRLSALADELAAAHGTRADVLTADLADPASRDELLGQVEALGLRVDILVNNAGFGTAGRFQDADPEVQVGIVRVNVEAAVALTGAFVGEMVRRGRGAVLNVASTTAFQPVTYNATYAASKAFLLSFTEALHTDLAGTGVTATALCPGPVRTEIWSEDNAASVAERLPGIMWLDAGAVAEQGIDGLAAGKRVVVPGRLNRLGALGGQHAPRSVLLRAAALLTRREGR